VYVKEREGLGVLVCVLRMKENQIVFERKQLTDSSHMKISTADVPI
jgi:hypothetical protein